MKNKIINIILTSITIIFSFFYTNKIINYFKYKDPIMIEIMKYDDIYSDTKEDSYIVNNDIIPGIKGERLDIDKSYQKMKKAGKFDKNLLVFQESIPENDIKNNYKKYIVSLIKNQDSVSLVFVIDRPNYLENILSILDRKKVKATFFLSKEIFDNSISLVKKINDKGNQVELLSDSYSIYEVNKYNSILKLVSKTRLNFCINKEKNDALLNSCSSSKLYTIVPSINITNNLYLNIKNSLSNGLIISISNNLNNIKELSSSINYIIQKGKKIVLLKNIIE